jgi:hypothetical protein
MTPPLLLIDIDGVISLFGFNVARRPPGRFLLVDGVPHFLSTAAADLVNELRDEFELVWCSGWEEKADEYLPLVLGLPAGLAHLTFETGPVVPGAVRRHWKLAAIDQYAGPDRPLAWIDDAHDASCHAWVAGRSAPTLLVGTDPAVGITPADVDRLRAWAAEQRSDPATMRPRHGR